MRQTSLASSLRGERQAELPEPEPLEDEFDLDCHRCELFPRPDVRVVFGLQLLEAAGQCRIL